ncbi:MAG: sigma-70 family RNA polymerase sigma factor [Vicinamibacterales bacterium]
MSSFSARLALTHVTEGSSTLGERELAAEATVLQLFDAHAARLRRYAYRIGLSPEAAEDVVQDTFLAMHRHLLKGGNTDNLPGWLVQVCFHLALKSRHRVARRSAFEQPLEGRAFDVADAALSAENRLLRDQHLKWVSAVVDALPERDRQCLWMRAEGMTYRRIAEELGISLGAAAKAVARAAVRLSRG